MRDFRKFEVWQLSHIITLKVYELSRNFPREELFGLTSQIRRSFASIGYNISEGCGRNSDKEFANFINIALGSASEAEYQFLLARDLDYVEAENYDAIQEEIVLLKKKLVSLWNKLNNN
ncbi:MAG: four helix bundle protein [Chryseobacterium sp.]|nr:MAG: four helix bundle protein [Chryseobacterium sp.]